VKKTMNVDWFGML